MSKPMLLQECSPWALQPYSYPVISHWHRTQYAFARAFLQFGLFILALHLSLAGNLGCLTRVRLQQPQEQCYPFLTVHVVFSSLQTKVWLPVLGIFNVCIDYIASDCTWGLFGHCKTVCTESWLWEKNPLLHRGIEPASAACQFNTLPSELHPCFIVALCCKFIFTFLFFKLPFVVTAFI